MLYLLIVSFIWAFSFGLIKDNLTGLDSNLVACARMALSFLVFLPFLRLKGLRLSAGFGLMGIGAVQFGVMYATYIYSYQFLPAYQVALYTIFTPLYVTLIDNLLSRRLELRFIAAALLAIVGAYIIVRRDIHSFELQAGFALLQVSNLSFALGQVLYKRYMNRKGTLKDHHVFSLLYLGALAVTAAGASLTTDWTQVSLTLKQGLTLLYLGVLASGLCFFLWNFGARRTDTGTLAVMNNFKIPLAVACSIVFFKEEGDLPRLLLGGGIIVAALLLNEFLSKASRSIPPR